MIFIKSQREIELMRTAGDILARTRQMLVPHIKPGISTYQLDQLAEKFILDNGATPTFKGYNGFPGAICTSVNEEVIHGIPSKAKILKNGDIISIDIGVTYRGYIADSAWTFPVGSIDEKVSKLLEITQQALFIGLEQIKPGAYVGDIGYAIEQFVKPHGYGIVVEFTGHGVGRKLHEAPYIPNFGKAHTGELLREGMTFCVEPMINLGTKGVKVLTDNWTTITVDKNVSAHFEHTIVVTKNGYDILSKIKEQ